jgi:hypothetical protein
VAAVLRVLVLLAREAVVMVEGVTVTETPLVL